MKIQTLLSSLVTLVPLRLSERRCPGTIDAAVGSWRQAGRCWQGSALVSLAAVALTTAQAQTVDSVLTNRLAEPTGVAIEAGVFYISDTANDRVVRFVPDSGVFTTLAGFAGRPGSTDGKGVYARFFSPRGIVSVPGRNGLVVSDYGNHTLRLVRMDGTVTTIAGTAGTPGLDSAHFNFPSALATDSEGNVYVADSKNNAVRKLDLAGNLSTIVTGLNEPDGLAVGDNGDLWISDTRNNVIRRRAANGTVELVAGIPGQDGALDSIFANEALFNGPTAMIWLNAANGLLVADTGNHALRRIFYDPEISGYSVETYAGIPTQPGFLNGPLREAKFKLPSGLTKDPVGGFLISDLGNNALRRIQTSAPQPPVSDPDVGYVTFVKDSFGELLSKLVPVTQAVFNNDVIIAILSEPATETYFTYGDTPPSSLEDNIPSPNRLVGNSPPLYRDESRPEDVPPSIIPPQPDVTIKVIGTQDGRRPSQVVQARFQFKTANPAILGENPASFLITNITVNAQMWYTTDGSDPTVNGPTSKQISVGKMSLPRSADPILFKVRAFRNDYKPSEIVSKQFLPEDFQANRISFGFENGEASSDFTASPGQTFYAPVTLSLLPGQTMYTLQFNLTVSSLGTSPAVGAGAVSFVSMLMEKVTTPDGTIAYRQIPPAMFLNGQSGPPQTDPGFGDLGIVNPSDNLMAVGWLERNTQKPLYDSTKQDLITYSIAHDTVFLSQNQRVIVGGYTFVVPPNAPVGSTYEIKVARPSATSDGVGQDNYIEAVTDGTLTASPTNLINSIKHVAIGQKRYVVGDVAPFRWFNAGDFGEGYLLNNDVVQVFQSAVYGLNNPPFGTELSPSGVQGLPNRSDFFDAMDAANGVSNPAANNVYSGSDLAINDIKFGDGVLNVDDVYVTFRRSLDPSLVWYQRYWENGVRQAEAVPNVFRGAPSTAGERLTLTAAEAPAGTQIPGLPSVTFSIEDLQVLPGQTLQIPVRSKVVGGYPLRVLMLNLTVEELDGSPALTVPVEFTPVAAIGRATLTRTQTAGNFAGAWLDSKISGVIGDAVIGHLTVTIPANAPVDAAYRVHFGHASASPNGLGVFPKLIQDGLLTLRDRSSSSLHDNIPDTWRLRHFGSVSSALAQAAVDADRDGASNAAEFKAGTDPVNAQSHFHVDVRRGASPIVLRWLSALDRNYIVESAPSLNAGPWTALDSTVPGTGAELQYTPALGSEGAQFFRVRIAE